MTIDEETQLEAFSHFVDGVLSFHDLHEKYKESDPERGSLLHATAVYLIPNLAKKEARTGGDVIVLNKSGERYFERLRQRGFDEEATKIHFEDEKILVRQIQSSTLNTNKSVRRLNRFQKPILAVGILLSILTLIVINEQRKLSEKQYVRDSLMLEKSKAVDSLQFQIQLIKTSLDSMRDFQNINTSKEKK